MLDHNIKLSESAARHAGAVLRLNVGDAIILFNGDGHDYSAELVEATRKNVVARISSKTQNHSESPLKLHLVQALIKSDKMDWVIQKAVELGVTEITPVQTKYCAVKVFEKKMAHWQGIILSACEQSGRSVIPTLNPVITLEKFFDNEKIQSGYIFHPDATQKLSDVSVNKTQAGAMLVLIGPEGGFHEDEIRLAEIHGFHSVQIGRRILRAETAAVTVLSLMQYTQGDF